MKAGDPMDIQILELLDGARRARGLTVVIDVFRAFSLEAWLFARGAAEIFAVGAESEARRLKAEHPGAVLIGERGGAILPGFDFGNSPSQTRGADFRGKTVIHTTSAGTQGLAGAAGAAEIVAGSLVNAAATARYIRSRDPERVSLVAMGLAGASGTPEDRLCARYVKALLEGETLDMERELEAVKDDAEGRKFFDPARQDVFPEDDFWMCTDVDRFGFVIRARRLGDGLFRMSALAC